MLRVVDGIARAIHESPRWKFLTVLLAIAILKSGVWFVPNIALSASIAEDPFTSHPESVYLMENWLAGFLAWLLGMHGTLPYLLMHALFAVAFVAVVLVLLFRRLPEASARNAAIVFAALPASMTAFYWIGLDGLTLLLLALALLASRRWWLVAPIGVLLGLHHFEQGVFASGALLLAAGLGALLRTGPWRAALFPAALLAGDLVGFGVRSWIFAANGIVVDYDRVEYLVTNLRPLVRGFVENPAIMVFSMLALGWIVVIRYAAASGRRALPLLVALGCLVLLMPFYEDRTRVAAITSFLLVTATVLLDERFMAGIGRRESAVFAALWFIVPWLWVWGDVTYTSVTVYDLEVVLNRLTGHPGDVPHGAPELGVWAFR